MRRLRIAHLAVSILGLMAFILSGLYMHRFLGHLKNMPDGPRLLYRSAHIYLLWASLPNLLLGANFHVAAGRYMRQLQLAASIMLMAAPLLIAFSFFNESQSPVLFRPVARTGIYLALAGCLVHAFASLAARQRLSS